jgi:rhodanese-related sulfurtransferase
MDHSEKFVKLVNEAKAQVREVSVDEVNARRERGEEMLLIDTREDHEWDRGHIPGAIHLSKGIIERDIENMVPDEGREIILYCGGGFRSALAAESLQKMGYTNVRSMSGGWRAWQAHGLEVEEG